MDTTVNRDYPFPEATDNVQLWTWFQLLAEALDLDVQAVVDRPHCKIVQTVANTGITDNTAFAVTFTGTDIYDPNGMHSPSVNNTRITPNVPGWYTVRGAVCFGGQTDFNNVESYFRKNGTTAIEPANMITPSAVAGTLVLPVVTSIDFNGSSDYAELMGRMDRSGNGTGSTAVSAQRASMFEVIYEHPL